MIVSLTHSDIKSGGRLSSAVGPLIHESNLGPCERGGWSQSAVALPIRVILKSQKLRPKDPRRWRLWLSCGWQDKLSCDNSPYVEISHYKDPQLQVDNEVLEEHRPLSGL